MLTGRKRRGKVFNHRVDLPIGKARRASRMCDACGLLVPPAILGAKILHDFNAGQTTQKSAQPRMPGRIEAIQQFTVVSHDGVPYTGCDLIYAA